MISDDPTLKNYQENTKSTDHVSTLYDFAYLIPGLVKRKACRTVSLFSAAVAVNVSSKLFLRPFLSRKSKKPADECPHHFLSKF